MLHMILGFSYIFICLLIGFLGRYKKLGFWGYFFGSIVLSPVIGLVLLFASDSRQDDD